MNSEQFIDCLYSCTSQKELDALKKAIEVELDALNSKNTTIEPKMEKYIKYNYNKVIDLIFVEPNELDGKLAQQLMFKRANSLEKHLNLPMGTFFHTWNGIKLQKHEQYKEQVLEHKELLRELGKKQYQEQIAMFQEKMKKIEEVAW